MKPITLEDIQEIQKKIENGDKEVLIMQEEAKKIWDKFFGRDLLKNNDLCAHEFDNN